jgi:hypothetical protein
MPLVIEPFVIVGVVALVSAIGAGTWWFSPHQRALRALRACPVVAINRAADGATVRIVGAVRARAPMLASPLSGRECVAYDLVLEELVKTGKSSHWRQILHLEDACEFEIVDATGRAIVEAKHIAVALIGDAHARTGLFEDATPELLALLDAHGLSATGLFGMNKGLRVREGVLEPDETIAVLGRARWENDPEARSTPGELGGYRGLTVPRWLVIEAPDGAPVRASDDPAAMA